MEFDDTTIRARQRLADCIGGSSWLLSDGVTTETDNCIQPSCQGGPVYKLTQQKHSPLSPLAGLQAGTVKYVKFLNLKKFYWNFIGRLEVDSLSS